MISLGIKTRNSGTGLQLRRIWYSLGRQYPESNYAGVDIKGYQLHNASKMH